MTTFLFAKWFSDERTLEEEADRKIGWFLKLIFVGTATAVAYNFFPYMGMPPGFMSLVSLLTSLDNSSVKLTVQEILCYNNLSHFCMSRIPCLKEWEHLDCPVLQ